MSIEAILKLCGYERIHWTQLPFTKILWQIVFPWQDPIFLSPDLFPHQSLKTDRFGCVYTVKKG